MSPFLDNGQTLRLERILEEVQLKQENSSDYEEDNAELLEKFIAAKRLEGRSDGTLNYYKFTIERMFEDIGKNIRAITTEDLRDYLSRYYTEKEVSKVTIDNIRRNLLSFFTWLEDENYIIDLLFYHRGLQCLVAIELKVGKFKPEYVSKLDFYLEALDRQVKKENENPSVGLLLCATKNDEVVEYSMSRTMSPMMVAEYQLQLPDKEILQKKLQELINIPLIEE